MLEVIAGIISRRLPTERPLWKATLITGVPGGRTVLVVVFHHVLADGIGGLAMLAQLMDGMPPVAAPTFPHRPPQRRDLIRDALRYRLRAVGRLPAAVARLRTATAELGTADSPDAPRCSLNHPIGSRRALAVARVDLDVVRAAAHAHGGTVNDVVLTAVAGGVGTVLAERGEELDRLVISMPVSARRQATTTELGNQVGVIRVAIPTTGEPVTRLTAVAGITRPRKFVKGGTSAALIAPVFRLLAKAGIFGWFVNRQHLVNTFVSNLRGPEHALSFLGLPVGDIIPISMISGNVTVAFTALSYAGTLNITVVADPEQCPDFSRMAGAIQAELRLLTGVPV